MSIKTLTFILLGAILTFGVALTVRSQPKRLTQPVVKECSQSFVEQLTENQLDPIINYDPQGQVVTVCVSEYEHHVSSIQLSVWFQSSEETQGRQILVPKTMTHGILRLRLPKGRAQIGLDRAANNYDYFEVDGQPFTSLSVDGSTFFNLKVAKLEQLN